MGATKSTIRGHLRVGLTLCLALAIAGCDTLNNVEQTFLGGSGGVAGPGSQRITGFLGGVVADEPTAALAGREVLAQGGNAADAAVAVGLTLAVTYPSRASLGAGGACLAYNPSRSGPGAGRPEMIAFVPQAPATLQPRTDRPAAVPMLARGLFVLHARYGRRPFETLIVPAEQLARFGTPASRAFVNDLRLVAAPLMADPNARATFAPGGQVLTDGAMMIQPDLGATLAPLRVAGGGDLYQGGLGRRFETAAAQAGGGVTFADLRSALPRVYPPIVVSAGVDSVAFLAPPADGGLAAAVAFQTLQASPGAYQAANDRALATAARWRAGGATAASLLANPPTGGSLPSLPASTTFATLDRDGNAVVCAITMNNLFGTGRIAPGTCVVLAASPASVPLPLLAAGMAWNEHLSAFRAAVGGSGQEGAPLAVAAGMEAALQRQTAVRVPNPGRMNVITCSGYLPDADNTCRWAGDPRDSGLAVGSN